ncbi:GDP-mannose 4,6-dehydratase [Candidatus Kaiserbacteria bacterium RIFCSPHIGHO2_02_FULL_59_21]|uniref:GDP-mannose 4,6-dehydratase n=1 Tax=Candidatus Kaiserbacteria bacterium RIFCSPHIGHO2_02_FULL_59_21 TaxID=1798500 RepID=A0A1F6DZ25_9BACT|nr:MAG: GDP-mannose 4,6-dehydratase [Candidatus Kaiserbacteria bacterium RIFCSPHIGHO2_02_FULL_59_21]
MKKKKRALITGITGQDGSYVAELLVRKGYEVFGLVRRSSNDPFVRLKELIRERKITILYGDMRDSGAIRRALERAEPDEIYNLAAQSDVGISFMCPEEAGEINYHGLGRLVHAVLDGRLRSKIYQASTSEMFGSAKPPQNENTPFQPVSPYGVAKLRAHEDYVVGYRKKYPDLFICSGILFNHESPRRGQHFVTRKISISLAKIKLGLQDYVELGNLNARRDWGYAGDFVEAMWLMLQREKPADYVIATGQVHTVRDFVNETAKALDMHIAWSGSGTREVGKTEAGKVIVRVNKKFFRPVEVDHLLGDSGKARRELGWKPRVSFEDLAAMMAKADLEAVASEHRGSL